MGSNRMPQLVIDEVILLVDTYFRLQNITSSALRKDMVNDLSVRMKKLPFFPELREDAAFRSPDGMQMCLANIGFIDPSNGSKFGHGSRLQRRVFEYYKDKKELLKQIASTINRIAEEKFDIDHSYDDFIGGCLLPSYHVYLERVNKTIKIIKQENLALDKTVCTVCGRELAEVYKTSALLLELHIGIPISEYVRSLEITPSNVTVLCPTCHKLAHSEPQLFDIDLLQAEIKG